MADAWQQRDERSFHRAGAIAAAIYNVNRGKAGRWIEAADIFPQLKKQARRQRPATDAEINLFFRGVAIAHAKQNNES